jgi:ribosomal protein L37AE/L43A
MKDLHYCKKCRKNTVLRDGWWKVIRCSYCTEVLADYTDRDRTPKKGK